MKTTDHFKRTIQMYLEQRAEEDALFEDIKNGLKGINDRLENATKVSNGQSGEQAPTMDLAP